MNGYAIFIKRGHEFVKQSWTSSKRAAISSAKELNKLGYEVKVEKHSQLIISYIN